MPAPICLRKECYLLIEGIDVSEKNKTAWSRLDANDFRISFVPIGYDKFMIPCIEVSYNEAALLLHHNCVTLLCLFFKTILCLPFVHVVYH